MLLAAGGHEVEVHERRDRRGTIRHDCEKVRVRARRMTDGDADPRLDSTLQPLLGRGKKLCREEASRPDSSLSYQYSHK